MKSLYSPRGNFITSFVNKRRKFLIKLHVMFIIFVLCTFFLLYWKKSSEFSLVFTGMRIGWLGYISYLSYPCTTTTLWRQLLKDMNYYMTWTLYLRRIILILKYPLLLLCKVLYCEIQVRLVPSERSTKWDATGTPWDKIQWW